MWTLLNSENDSIKMYAYMLGLTLVVASSSFAQDSRWPGAPKVGVRAGLGGSTGTPGIDVGNVGIKVLMNDKMAFLADLGLSIQSVGNYSSASFAIGGGLNFDLNEPTMPLRPYIPVFLSFGAEYFFSKQFSFSSDLVLGLRFSSLDPFTVKFATLTPGVHVSYYF